MQTACREVAVGPITIVFGVVLIVLGLFGFIASGARLSAWTALIPAFFGLPLLALGFLARKEHLRMHVMHAAALIGLVGLVVPAARALPKLPELISTGKVVVSTDDGGVRDATLAIVMQLLMALTCVVFVGLCVKSFIDARVARSRAEGSPQT
jgi:hypothetical protein